MNFGGMSHLHNRSRDMSDTPTPSINQRTQKGFENQLVWGNNSHDREMSRDLGLTSPSEMVGHMFNPDKMRSNLFEGASSDSFSMGQDAGNLGLSMWNNSSSNPVFQGQQPGGASMGATVPESHLYAVLEEVLRRMGINLHGSVFNPNTNPAITGAMADGISSGLQNRSVQVQPTPPMSNDADSANQVGNAIGQNLNCRLAGNAINNCGQPQPDNTVGGDKDTREMIGQYMDQHTNVYSKPETKDGKETSWKDALANQDQLSPNSIALVNIARKDLITHLEGGNVGANHPGTDCSHAMMNADAGQTNCQIAQQQRQQLMTV